MASLKKGLGRGLESLLGEASAEIGAIDESRISMSRIRTNPDQPRKDFDEEGLKELAESIRANGVLQPILVRPVGEGYEIVAGERRYQAAKLAGLNEIPCVVRQVSDEEVFQLALIENLQRSDLNPVEEARGYKRLIEEKALTQEGLAKVLSKSRPAVANTLRLLELPDEVLDMVAAGDISAGHGRAILAVPEEEDRIRLAKKAASEKLSVREVERLAPLYASGGVVPAHRQAAPASFKKAAKRLRKMLEAKVRVHTARGRNKIEIEFDDEDDLNRILEKMEG